MTTDVDPAAEAVLEPLHHTEPGEMADLHRRLVADALDAGLLDIGYRSIDSPIGPLLLAATPLGLLRIGFSFEGHDHVLESLAEKVSPRILSARGRLDIPARELDEYFAGSRRTFDMPLDLRLSRGFRRQVLEHLRAIRYGQTQSYTEVARAAGNPRAVRAVGSACATNPLPIVVPCHRVLRSDGSLGGYAGGLEVKRILLNLETAA